MGPRVSVTPLPSRPALQMTLDQFYKLNRGIDQGRDLPEAFLKVGAEGRSSL